MNMPGFTAESSVYRTSGHYRMIAGFDANNRNVIRPQLCNLDCLGECLPVLRWTCRQSACRLRSWVPQRVRLHVVTASVWPMSVRCADGLVAAMLPP